MPAAVMIAVKDLTQRLRDRSAIVIGFVAPAVLAGLISVAFGGAEEFSMDLALVDADGGDLAAALTDVLASPELADIISLELFDDEAAARAAVDDGDAGAALVIPAGFSDAAAGEAPQRLRVLTTVDSQLAGDVTQGIAQGFMSEIAATRLSVLAAVEAGAPAADLSALVTRASERRATAAVVPTPTGAHAQSAVSYYAPSMAMFFAFFAVGFAARSYLGERRDGTLDRLLVGPVRPGAVLLGKALSVLVYSLASLLSMWGVTAIVFGADWGDPPAALALIVAFSASVAALAAVVIATARTERQADGMAGAVVFGLALLGGSFVQQSAFPPLLQRLTLLTPNGWALRGFVDVSTGSDDLAMVAGPAGAILLITVVLAAVAALAWRRTVAR